MKIWVTTVGTTPFAVINSLWAAIDQEGWVPKRIYLIASKNTQKYIPGLVRVIEVIVTSYGGEKIEVVPVNINESDFKIVYENYFNIIKKEKKDDNEVAIDITPGRKYMSAFAMYCALRSEPPADKIYYAHIKGGKFQNLPYPYVPAKYIVIKDILSMREEFT